MTASLVRIVLLWGSALGSVFTPISGIAADRAFCSIYATHAMMSANRNVEYNCGFGGPSWSNGKALADNETGGHFKWCLNASQEDAEGEEIGRLHTWDNCPQADRCRTYAKFAMRDIAVARNNFPVFAPYFTGNRWGENEAGHENWCKTAPNEHVDSEHLARMNELAKKAMCHNYAGLAHGSFVAMNNKRCGLSGPRWMNNDLAHFKWCMGVSYRTSEEEHRARVEELRNCRPKH